MTVEEIKQLARKEYGSLAHLGRKLSPPVSRQMVWGAITGQGQSARVQQQVARRLKLSVRELVAAHSTYARKTSKD